MDLGSLITALEVAALAALGYVLKMQISQERLLATLKAQMRALEVSLAKAEDDSRKDRERLWTSIERLQTQPR